LLQCRYLLYPQSEQFGRLSRRLRSCIRMTTRPSGNFASDDANDCRAAASRIFCTPAAPSGICQ
jgi:hypothetical protein